MAQIDMTGERVGKWTVIEPVKHGQYGTYWRCRCDCGNEKVVRGWSLRHGNSSSCGCDLKVTHGYCRGNAPKRLYNIWRNMRARCQNPNNIGYHLYGGRGITICDEWRDFPAFAKWAEEAGYRDDLSIDRIDNDGPYAPWNCRWATNSEQQRNRRNTVWVTSHNQTKTLDEWAETLGVTLTALQHRRQRGTLQEYLDKTVGEE